MVQSPSYLLYQIIIFVEQDWSSSDSRNRWHVVFLTSTIASKACIALATNLWSPWQPIDAAAPARLFALRINSCDRLVFCLVALPSMITNCTVGGQFSSLRLWGRIFFPHQIFSLHRYLIQRLPTHGILKSFSLSRPFTRTYLFYMILYFRCLNYSELATKVGQYHRELIKVCQCFFRSSLFKHSSLNCDGRTSMHRATLSEKKPDYSEPDSDLFFAFSMVHGELQNFMTDHRLEQNWLQQYQNIQILPVAYSRTTNETQLLIIIKSPRS